jgi:hypothetical protein
MGRHLAAKAPPTRPITHTQYCCLRTPHNILIYHSIYGCSITLSKLNLASGGGLVFDPRPCSMASRLLTPSRRRFLAKIVLVALIGGLILHAFRNIYSSSVSRNHVVGVTNKGVPDGTTSTIQNVSTVPNRKGNFAYAYVVAGCNSSSCTGYLLNALVATTILRHYNSTSDVVFQVRMASNSKDTKLSEIHEHWLQRAGIHLRYLPKVPYDNFGTATLEKFRVLELTEYDRVYFLDADMIPLCNTDYQMEKSYYSGELQLYVGLQGGIAPVNGGGFIVTPKRGLFRDVVNIVHRHRNKTENPATFDPMAGWGHQMAANDPWIGRFRQGNQWDFHGVGVDQGVLYQWLKYQVLGWSHILQNGQVHTWQEVTLGGDHLQDAGRPTKSFKVANNKHIAVVNVSNLEWKGCGRGVPANNGKGRRKMKGPFLDLVHYGGKQKPWGTPIRAETIPLVYETVVTLPGIWLYWLGVANRTWGLRLSSYMDLGGPGRPLNFDGDDNNTNLLEPHIVLPIPLD